MFQWVSFWATVVLPDALPPQIPITKGSMSCDPWASYLHADSAGFLKWHSSWLWMISLHHKYHGIQYALYLIPWRSAGGVDCPLARLEDLFSVRAYAGRCREGSFPPVNMDCEIDCVARSAQHLLSLQRNLSQIILHMPVVSCKEFRVGSHDWSGHGQHGSRRVWPAEFEISPLSSFTLSSLDLAV